MQAELDQDAFVLWLFSWTLLIWGLDSIEMTLASKLGQVIDRFATNYQRISKSDKVPAADKFLIRRALSEGRYWRNMLGNLIRDAEREQGFFDRH